MIKIRLLSTSTPRGAQQRAVLRPWAVSLPGGSSRRCTVRARCPGWDMGGIPARTDVPVPGGSVAPSCSRGARSLQVAGPLVTQPTGQGGFGEPFGFPPQHHPRGQNSAVSFTRAGSAVKKCQLLLRGFFWVSVGVVQQKPWHSSLRQPEVPVWPQRSPTVPCHCPCASSQPRAGLGRNFCSLVVSTSLTRSCPCPH